MARKAALWAAVGTGLAVLVAALFLGFGVRLFAVMSPSMGQAAPVGTLVVTRPSTSYAVGDIVSFPSGTVVHTHRIVEAHSDGTFTTQGDLNTVPDPVPVAIGDIIGKAVWTARGLGWVLLGLPWLVLGVLVVFLLSLIGTLPRPWRWSIRIGGWTLVVCLIAVWLRPWINLAMLGFTPADDGGVLMHVVNTGLFPLDAGSARLVSGQDAVVHVTDQNAAGYYTLTPSPALTLLQHLLVFLVCLIPLAASLLVPPAQAAADTAAPAPGRRTRTILVAAIVAAVVIAVGVVNSTMAHAALTARIQNTTDTTGSRTYFTCRNAETGLGRASTYLVYAAGTTGTTETDLSGNSRTGTYTTTATVTANYGCQRDTPLASATFNGATCLYPGTATTSTPNTFSLEAWFRTTTKSNGKIIGFGNSRTIDTTNWDRHIYIDVDGRIVFGVYPSAIRLVYTPAGANYADGSWHHVIATLSPAGQYLYVDGTLAMSTTTVTTAEAIAGYWKIGCGRLSGWQNANGTTYTGPDYFTGQIQYAAIYTIALTATQAREHYQAGTP